MWFFLKCTMSEEPALHLSPWQSPCLQPEQIIQQKLSDSQQQERKRIIQDADKVPHNNSGRKICQRQVFSYDALFEDFIKYFLQPQAFYYIFNK